MKEIQNPFEKHIFVCCNTKSDGSGCAPKGGEVIRDKLKVEATSVKNCRIRVNKSGCLGFCENGVVVAVYPEGKLFVDVKVDEVKIGDFINL